VSRVAGARLRNLGYWTALVACVELGVGELAGWLRFALTGSLKGPDFYIYYATSLVLLERGPSWVYDFAVQKTYQDQVTTQWGGHFILLPHILPPWATLLLYPLALQPFRGAYLAWGILNLLLVALAIALLLRAGGLSARPALLAAAAAGASLPVAVLVLQGQSDGLMLGALAASALAWTRAKAARSAGFAVLALVKPQLMLLLPVLFAVRRSVRAVAAFIAGCLFLVVVSLAVFGLPACLAWLRVLAPWAFGGTADFPVDTQSQYSLRGLLQLLGLPLGVQLALLLLGLAGLAVVLLLSRADPRLELALAIAGSMALSPYQHAHDLVLLLVPGLLLAGALPALRHPSAGAWVLLGAWLGLELLVVAPWLTALAITAATAYLAWECLLTRRVEVAD
jgi:hypothetical protein